MVDLTKLEAACTAITNSWGYGPIDIVFHGLDHAYIEAVLHEAAHAVSLGLALEKLTPAEVSWAIADLSDSSDPFDATHGLAALDEEARAWCIEWILIQRLGLDFNWGDVEVAASEQGVNEDQLVRWKDTAQIQPLADKLYTWLEGLVA